MTPGILQINYHVEWDIPEDDTIAQLRGTNHIEQVFDGAEGQRRGSEHVALLREAEAQGMCSNITVKHRRVSVVEGDWEDGEPQ